MDEKLKKLRHAIRDHPCSGGFLLVIDRGGFNLYIYPAVAKRDLVDVCWLTLLISSHGYSSEIGYNQKVCSFFVRVI